MTQTRCQWCEGDALYQKYHDEEWGKPVDDDQTLFEFLVLESFQAGLSWITILRKREHFRQALDNFNYQKIAQYNEEKIEKLMQNEGIVRHRAKIIATINNAQKFMDIQREYGSFSQYLWGFTEGKIIDNRPKTIRDIPATTPLSEQIAKDLKKRGFKFLRTATIYTYLQAIDVVNDHIINCIIR